MKVMECPFLGRSEFMTEVKNNRRIAVSGPMRKDHIEQATKSKDIH